MHDKSWDLANTFTDVTLPVFAFPTMDMDKCLPGLLEPWMNTALEQISKNGLRRGSVFALVAHHGGGSEQ
jgi:hypothetical protein